MPKKTSNIGKIMEYTMTIVWAIVDIVNEMSPYLLLGFLLAGIMHAFIPANVFNRYLSGHDLRSVAYAALMGIPLPLCSCGVIPTAMSLRRDGASEGAATSFLIATPQTGVDSIIATYSLMGLPFAIIRPIVALLTALLGGQMVNWFGSSKETDPGEGEGHKACCCNCSYNHHHEHQHTFIFRIREALRYAFIEMMGDIGKWLVVGLIVAGLITVLVPDTFFQAFEGNSLMSMLLVLLLAIPMYLCATGSIPIAVALMVKGLTPGAALVLLMAGPASNVASIIVIRKALGTRTMMVYLASIILGAMAFGLCIDHLMPQEWFLTPLSSNTAHCNESSLFSWVWTVVLIIMLINALIRHKHGHKA